jgi:hypothetical protein
MRFPKSKLKPGERDVISIGAHPGRSLEPLKAFSSGGKVRSTTGSAAAIPFYKRPTELDPNFALARVDGTEARASGS